MRKLLCLLSLWGLCLFPVSPAAATETVTAAPEAGAGADPAWASRDSLAATRFIEAMLHRPESIDSIASGSLKRDHDLGFGRRLREAWIDPAGALGFSLKIVYAGGRPIGFEALPVMNYGRLRARYQAVLAPAFKIKGGGEAGHPLRCEPYRWNLEAVSAPLPADSLGLAGDTLPAPPIRAAFAYYMSPYSGTLYGIRGGQQGQMLENRDRFLDLAGIVAADKRLVRYLIRSPNPATRLTAAEYILRHKADFPAYDSLERTALRAAFSHPAKAATLRGGKESFEDARKLVTEYARPEIIRDGRGVLRMY
jgi:hypothetical protein